MNAMNTTAILMPIMALAGWTFIVLAAMWLQLLRCMLKAA
jgi:hypothetical protein